MSQSLINKVASVQADNFINKSLHTDDFQWILRIKNVYFEEDLWTAASVNCTQRNLHQEESLFKYWKAVTSVFQTWNNVKTKPFQAKSGLIYQKKTKIKIDTFYRNWTGSFWKIPQSSKFERFLFNIFHSIFLFVEKPDVCNFTDDDTIYSVLGLLNLNSH